MDIDPFDVIANRVFDRWKEKNAGASDKRRKEAKDTIDRGLMKDIFEIDFSTVSYSDFRQVSKSLDNVDGRSLTNETNRDLPLTYSANVNVTDTFTFAFTEAIRAGVQTTVQTGIPFLASGEIQISLGFDFSSTQTVTTTKSLTTALSATFTAGPGETIDVEVLQSTVSFDMKATFIFRYRAKDRDKWDRKVKPLFDRDGGLGDVLNSSALLELPLGTRLTGTAGTQWDIVARVRGRSDTRTQVVKR